MPLSKVKRFLFGPGPNVPRELAMKVFERDQFQCQYCGLDAKQRFEDWLILTIDHVHPYARGGTRKLDNLVTACRPCNVIKGRRPFATREEAKKYVVARREEWLQRYHDEMKGLKAHN